MDPISEVKFYENSDDLIPLMVGGPGPDTLKDCKDIFIRATAHVLDQEVDVTAAFRYGPETGDKEFREELAKFLSMEYRDAVDSSHLMLTAGATQGLHFLATLLVNKHALVFVEDPTYYAAYRMLQHDFQTEIVPVPMDENGMKTDILDQLLTEHRTKGSPVTAERPFWAMIYVITVFNNPTGLSYSEERCKELVQIARKHDVLVVSEDIYNMIYYSGDQCPKRLLQYDNKSEDNYKGHVVSNCTFSKILAPGLRLGWIEAPDRILNCLHTSNLSWSCGSLNHYASKLAAAIMKLGMQENHVQLLRQTYKERMILMCDTLEKNLPSGAHFIRPKGGFFVWVQLPESIDALKLLRFAVKRQKINFLPGFCASPGGHYKNCVRLSISFCNKETIIKGLKAFCSSVEEFLAGSGDS